MIRGFKDFILRGNVVDLAVGIVIGASFTALVAALTDGFLKPLIQIFGGAKDKPEDKKGTFELAGAIFDYATFINAALTFLLTAAALYFLVVFPMNKLEERRHRGEEPPPKAPSEEVKLLTEIRDALAAGQGTGQRGSALENVLQRDRSGDA